MNDLFEAAYNNLSPLLKGAILKNELMSKYTTFRVGGPASLFILAENINDLQQIVHYAKEKDIDFFILGRGANLLISDAGYEGIVIRLGPGFNKISVLLKEEKIVAGSAVSLARVVQEAYSNSLEGLDFAAGIPATVGGAITSNAGAFGREICSLVDNIKILTKEGELVLRNEPLDFSYRKGPINKYEVVLEATFKLKAGDKIEIKAKTERYFKKRKKSQPLSFANAGSIFKNPSDEVSAGELIDKCGLKQTFIGEAMVSDEHANFIVNKGSAKAEDIYKLMKTITKKVKEKYDVLLEPEIKIIGRFDE